MRTMFQNLTRRKYSEISYFFPILRQYSSIEAIEEVDETRKKLSREINRFRELKPFKKNFIENLFLGIFEPTVLEYPQIRTFEEIEYLKEHHEKTKNLMLYEINSKEIDSRGKITKEVAELLVNKEIMGMKLKKDDLGLGYFESESFFIQESLALNSSVAKAVAEHESSGFQIINLFGSDAQKKKYIPKFLNGECVPCLAHLENGTWVSSNPVKAKTSAVKISSEHYSISGRKSLVYNASYADMLIVSARTNENNNDESLDSYTLFMVDKNSKGISILQPLDKIGLKGVEICDVVFNEVIVTKDNIIGNINEGNVIINKILSQGKLSNGAQCIGAMKKMLNETIDFCVKNNYFKSPLYTHKYIQGQIGNFVHKIYSAESMLYLMAGRADSFIKSDVFLESLIVKGFSSEILNFIVHECLQIIGRIKNSDEFIERIIRDCYFYSAFDDSNGYLKLFLASVGVKHTLDQMEKRTVKGYSPKSKLKLLLLKRDPLGKTPRILKGYLHLTLEMESELLEYCVMFLNFVTELLINEYGNKVIHKSWELSQLADLVTIIYNLAAVLGRASRSYCIGLARSETEVLLARNIAQNCFQKSLTIVKSVLASIEKQPPKVDDIGLHIFNVGKYSLLQKSGLWKITKKEI